MCDKDKLLYKSEMVRLKITDSCPCDYCQEVEALPAYRFLYEKSIQEVDFLPQALKPGRPSRVVPGRVDKTCDELGLSFYRSAHQALTFFRAKDGFPRMEPPYTCIGKCVLTTADGVVGETNKDGHFNVHPYVDAPILSSLQFDSFLAV
jgi:hypothetical protein